MEVRRVHRYVVNVSDKMFDKMLTLHHITDEALEMFGAPARPYGMT